MGIGITPLSVHRHRVAIGIPSPRASARGEISFERLVILITRNSNAAKLDHTGSSTMLNPLIDFML